MVIVEHRGHSCLHGTASVVNLIPNLSTTNSENHDHLFSKEALISVIRDSVAIAKSEISSFMVILN